MKTLMEEKMAKKVKKNGKTCWIDPSGDAIPTKYISSEDKKKDALVEKIVKKSLDLQNKIQKIKNEISEDVQKYLDDVSDKYSEKWKGNAELKNFAADKMVAVQISEIINFDEKLQIAKTKIDKCLERWSENSDENLALIVKKAFKTDKKGQLNKKMILALRQYKIKDKQWNEAMDLISASVKVENTKTYYNIKLRNEKGEFESIKLNFSDL